MELSRASKETPQDMKTRLFHLLKELAVVRQPITLASGKKSDIYIDCRQVYFRGEAQYLLGELFFRELLKLETMNLSFRSWGGMALGCVPLGCALSSAAFRRKRDIAGACVRKEAKSHGTSEVIEGKKSLVPDTQILLIEDVITTGGSAIAAARQFRDYGLHVSNLLAIVDRSQGGREALTKAGISLTTLFSISDFTSE